jgi:glycosyltransferase involved in cell wall biosynthesis
MLYSFVIPTRERHDVLGASIRSVLAQTRPNFELIVVDNFSSPETRAVVEGFADERIKYVRAPERLAMKDNWELALSHVSGDYVHFMGDDDGPLPDAIEVAEVVHAKWPDKILAWGISVYYWPDFYIPELCNQANVHLGRCLEIRNSREFLQDLYAYRNGANFSELPSVYYSFVPRTLIEKIRAKYGRYFLSDSPDIASGLMNAWHVEDFVFSYRPIAMLGVSRHSTGTSSLFPHINAGPLEQFKAERAAAAEKLLDERLSGGFIVEVCIGNELLRFRDKYFPEDSIRPDFGGLLEWFATAAPRFGDKRSEVEAAILDMAQKNKVPRSRLKIPPEQTASMNSFLYFVGKHDTVYMRYTAGPHVRDIADMTAEYARMVVAANELEAPKAPRRSSGMKERFSLRRFMK